MSTAFPQPAPGTAPSPGPMKVEADRLRQVLGLARIAYHDINHPIAITDLPLDESTTSTGGDTRHIVIDNFSFTPRDTIVPVGAMVAWINRDDVPHNVISTEKKFVSPVLDTNEQFSHRFDVSGTYPYYCSIHAKMTAQIAVG